MKTQIKNKFQLYWQRLQIAWKILTTKEAYITVWINGNEIKKVLLDQEFDARISYMRLQPYLIKKIILHLSLGIDRDQLALDKAEFEAIAEMYYNKDSPYYHKNQDDESKNM